MITVYIVYLVFVILLILALIVYWFYRPNIGPDISSDISSIDKYLIPDISSDISSIDKYLTCNMSSDILPIEEYKKDDTLPSKDCSCKIFEDKCPCSGFGEKNYQIVTSEMSFHDKKVKYRVNNQMKLQCFASTIEFCHDVIHKLPAMYTFKNIQSLWGGVLSGLAMVTINGSQQFYKYRLKYSNISKEMIIAIYDNEDKVLIFSGRIEISLIISDCVDTLITPTKKNSIEFEHKIQNCICR